MQKRPLDGLKVLDLTHVYAGPYCTYQLGLLGAEVIKVESPYGDMVRFHGKTAEQMLNGLGSHFVVVNAGKRCLCADLHTPEGREIIAALADRADILVENYRPGSVDSYGIGYEALRERNPRLIYVSISAFGHEGPLSHRRGFDDVVQAASGIMHVNASAEGPTLIQGAVIDYASGLQAASAILAAVLLREQTGEGQRVDIAMQDVAMLLINSEVGITRTAGPMPPSIAAERRAFGRRGPMLGHFEAKEGLVILAGYMPHHCQAIADALGLDEFKHITIRDLFDEEASLRIEVAVEERIAERTAEEWDVVFSERSVPAAAARDVVEAIETGHPEARGLLAEVATAIGNHTVLGNGYLINGESYLPRGGVATHGEHTAEVLRELGYDEDHIQALAESGVTSKAPDPFAR